MRSILIVLFGFVFAQQGRCNDYMPLPSSGVDFATYMPVRDAGEVPVFGDVQDYYLEKQKPMLMVSGVNDPDIMDWAKKVSETEGRVLVISGNIERHGRGVHRLEPRPGDGYYFEHSLLYNELGQRTGIKQYKTEVIKDKPKKRITKTETVTRSIAPQQSSRCVCDMDGTPCQCQIASRKCNDGRCDKNGTPAMKMPQSSRTITIYPSATKMMSRSKSFCPT